MVSKLGKGLLYLNVFAVLFVGILDDIHIDVLTIFERFLFLDSALIPLLFLEKKKIRLRRCKPILCALGIWTACMLGTSIVQHVPPIGFLNAFRTFCFPVIFFLGSIVFWDKRDVKRTYDLLKIWYVLNFALSLVEFAFFEKRDDMLGGLIGCRMGSNQYMNLIHCIMLIATLSESFSKDRLSPYTIFVIFSSVFLASLQELKFFYYEYILIFLVLSVIYIVQRRVSCRTLGIALLLSVASLGIGLTAMYFVYPKHFAVLVGKRSYSTYEKIARATYSISRMHFIKEINDLWFHGSLPQNLFGIGFGAGHPGTAFYEINEPMHYLYFAHQTLFLEGGLIGLGLFMAIFAINGLHCGWNFLRNRPISLAHTFGAVFSLIMLLNVIYNSAVRNYTAMLIWPVMAVPFIEKET